jgi:hypothetical protein
VATGVATRHPDLRIAEVPAHIGQPAWRASLQLQPGLVRTILADVGNQPGSLPAAGAHAVGGVAASAGPDAHAGGMRG